MRDLKRIVKKAITVVLMVLAMVFCFFQLSCGSCNSEEEIIYWIPATAVIQEPDVILEDSFEVVTIEEEIKMKTSQTNMKVPDSGESGQIYKCKKEDAGKYNLDSKVHVWSDEFEIEYIRLTIIFADVELEFVQDSKKEEEE